MQDQLEGLMPYIEETPRLKKRTYMDKEWLKLSLQTLTLKDSVIIISTDATLREAQQVLEEFKEVFILNITERENPKAEKKVIAQGNQAHIYELIRTI